MKCNVTAWGDFCINDFFELQKVTKLLSNRDISDNGMVPIQSATSVNNGIIGYTEQKSEFDVDALHIPYYLVFGDHTRSISIVDYNFCVMDNVKVLKPVSECIIRNKKIAYFITSVWKKSIPNMGYARHWSVARDIKFQLPICCNMPDWDYMAGYIASLEKKLSFELDNLQSALIYTKQTLNTTNWNTLMVGDVFNKLDLKTLNKNFNKKVDVSEEQTEEFSLPLVNAKHFNNGIQYYGREKDFESAEMTIDVVKNGAIATGDVYPQPQKTGVLWDAYLLKPKAEVKSARVLKFLATVLEKSIKEKFAWNDKCVWDRVKVLDIKLPVNSNGKIDFDYMEKYISSLEIAVSKKLDSLQKIVNDV